MAGSFLHRHRELGWVIKQPVDLHTHTHARTHTHAHHTTHTFIKVKYTCKTLFWSKIARIIVHRLPCSQLLLLKHTLSELLPYNASCFPFAHYSGAPKVKKIRRLLQNRVRHDVLHTCTMILSEHFRAHRYVCTDLLWL